MEQQPPKPMTPFDNITTPHHLYILKLLLPYTPPSLQRMLAIYIKFSELQYTFRHFQKLSYQEPGLQIISDLEPYMNTKEKETLEQMQEMMNMMEMVQNMQDIISPEDMQMFDVYNNIFENLSGNNDQKGAVTHERMDGASGAKKHGSSETGTD